MKRLLNIIGLITLTTGMAQQKDSLPGLDAQRHNLE